MFRFTRSILKFNISKSLLENFKITNPNIARNLRYILSYKGHFQLT